MNERVDKKWRRMKWKKIYILSQLLAKSWAITEVNEGKRSMSLTTTRLGLVLVELS